MIAIKGKNKNNNWNVIEISMTLAIESLAISALAIKEAFGPPNTLIKNNIVKHRVWNCCARGLWNGWKYIFIANINVQVKNSNNRAEAGLVENTVIITVIKRKINKILSQYLYSSL